MFRQLLNGSPAIFRASVVLGHESIEGLSNTFITRSLQRFWLDVPAVVQFDGIWLEPGKRSKRAFHFITEYLALVNLEEMQNLIVAIRAVWKNSKRGKLNTCQRST